MGSYMGTLRPKYLLFGYMEPLGICLGIWERLGAFTLKRSCKAASAKVADANGDLQRPCPRISPSRSHPSSPSLHLLVDTDQFHMCTYADAAVAEALINPTLPAQKTYLLGFLIISSLYKFLKR